MADLVTPVLVGLLEEVLYTSFKNECHDDLEYCYTHSVEFGRQCTHFQGEDGEDMKVYKDTNPGFGCRRGMCTVSPMR